MSNSLFVLISIFVIINVIQTYLILRYKLLVKGGILVGLIEGIEFPLLIVVILRGGLIGFLVIVSVESVQWVTIAIFGLSSKIKLKG